MEGGTTLRIGELSRRSGVSPELLRAWEQRYGLLQPARSAGGLRLYSLDDLERVQRMRRHLAEGVAAAEAAALASRPPTAAPGPAVPLPARATQELADALDAFDEPRAQRALDDLLALTSLDTFLTASVLPYLHELGERWRRGEASVAQEHFATAVLRGRLFALARGWGQGFGPLALLACVPGDQHDLGLIAFGLALRHRGWRIAYLGPDTPLDTLAAAAAAMQPDLVVLTAAADGRLDAVSDDLRTLASRHRVAFGGSGAATEHVTALGLIALSGDPVAAAERATELVRQPPPAAA